MTTVNIGSGVTSIASCPKTITVGLVGQTTSTWASDAILLVSTALKTDSDGYQFSMLLGINMSAATALFLTGGCVVTTGNYVCANVQNDTTGTYVEMLNNRWITKKDWAVTSFVAGTAITLAKWQMVWSGTAATCTGLIVSGSTAAVKAACVVALGTVDTGTGVIGMTYYQPKETSDLVYVGLPRFQKGESMKYIGLVNALAATAFPTVTCGTAKVLLGASNLIAGAAVAFGAATLAF